MPNRNVFSGLRLSACRFSNRGLLIKGWPFTARKNEISILDGAQNVASPIWVKPARRSPKNNSSSPPVWVMFEFRRSASFDRIGRGVAISGRIGGTRKRHASKLFSDFFVHTTASSLGSLHSKRLPWLWINSLLHLQGCAFLFSVGLDCRRLKLHYAPCRALPGAAFFWSWLLILCRSIRSL